MRNGKGTMKYANGDVYEGDWVDNQKEGKCSLIYKNGSTYTG